MRAGMKNPNKPAMLYISLVVCMVMVAMLANCFKLYQNDQVYAATQQKLEEEYTQEVARTEEIAEYAKYVKTDAFVEEVAREKLGFVYENEIIFREEP